MKQHGLACILACTLALGAACSSATSSVTAEETASTETQGVVQMEESTPMARPARAANGSNPMMGASDSGITQTPAIKDLAYASLSQSQTLDLYLPSEGDGPFPLIVAIHGGAFRMGSKTGGDVAAMVGAVDHGYAVASIDYRLSGEAVFPAAISDVKAAIRFLRAHADELNIDPDRIVTWGDSAGGNLASLAGTAWDDPWLDGEHTSHMDTSAKVQAVVDWFGPLDFLSMDEQFAESGVQPVFGATSSTSSPESQYIGVCITENEELTRKADPGNYISADDPPFFIQHGTADQNVPTMQSINFASLLGEEKATLVLLDGAGHGGSQFTSADNLAMIFDWLDKQLGTN